MANGTINRRDPVGFAGLEVLVTDVTPELGAVAPLPTSPTHEPPPARHVAEPVEHHDEVPTAISVGVAAAKERVAHFEAEEQARRRREAGAARRARRHEEKLKDEGDKAYPRGAAMAARTAANAHSLEARNQEANELARRAAAEAKRRRAEERARQRALPPASPFPTRTEERLIPPRAPEMAAQEQTGSTGCAVALGIGLLALAVLLVKLLV